MNQMFFWNSLAFWHFDVGILISGSSAFCKSNLYIWKFLVHILLKPSLKDFEHYLALRVKWVQLCGSLNILWHCPSLGLEWKLSDRHVKSHRWWVTASGFMSKWSGPRDHAVHLYFWLAIRFREANCHFRSVPECRVWHCNGCFIWDKLTNFSEL